MSSVMNFSKFKSSREASATVPRKKYETLKYKYKCLKQLFKIYDTNVQLTYAHRTRPAGQKRARDTRDVYVQANAEEPDNCPTTDRSESILYEATKAQEVTESDCRSERDETAADALTTDPVCVGYVHEYRSTPFDRRAAAESCVERPAYRTRKTIGLVKFLSKICGGDARSATDDGTSNRRTGCKRKRKKRKRRKRSLITLF